MKKLSILALFGSVALHSCGGSSAGGGGEGVFSSDTILASPFVSTVGSSSMLLRGSARLSASSFASRKAEIDTLLNATDRANCQFIININPAVNANCYGPQINRAIDDPAKLTSVGWDSLAQLPGGDVGIWNATNDGAGQACAAAQITAVVGYTSGRAHFANLMGAALYCYAKNDSSLGFPKEVGESIIFNGDQEDDFGFVDGPKTLALTSGKITKIEDSSGNKGLRYEAEGTITESAKVYTFKSVVQHFELADSLFKGRISYFIQEPGAENSGNCPSSGMAKDKTYAGHQTYEKASNSAFVIEMDSGTFCGITNPLDATEFTVSSANSRPTDVNGWGDNWNYALFRFDPRSAEPTFMDGKYLYAWQAGSGDSHTRVFNAELTSSGASRSGTAHFGFGPKVRTDSDQVEANRGKIQGMICNWLDGDHAIQPFVQRQTLSLTDGTWVAATSNIKYAPTNTCSYDPATVQLGYDATGSFTNDVALGSQPPNEAATRDLQSTSLDGSGFHQSFTGSFPTKPNF